MLDVTRPSRAQSAIPFDAARLDRLMDEAGIDVLFATSKHNVQYLLGGHRAFFFDYMDAMGLSPLSAGVGLSQGRARQGRLFRPSAGEFPARERAVLDAGAADAIRPASSTPCRRRSTTSVARRSRPQAIGAELAFLPIDAGNALRKAFPGSELKDARVRARAAARDQDARANWRSCRSRPKRVIDSMQAVIAKHGPGATKAS